MDLLYHQFHHQSDHRRQDHFRKRTTSTTAKPRCVSKDILHYCLDLNAPFPVGIDQRKGSIYHSYKNVLSMMFISISILHFPSKICSMLNLLETSTTSRCSICIKPPSPVPPSSSTILLVEKYQLSENNNATRSTIPG